MKSINLSISTVVTRMLLSIAIAAFLPGLAIQAQTQCPEGPGVKFYAPPNLDNGWDVRDSQGKIVLADDFFCNTTGYITDIHIWGSWLNNQVGTVTNFWLGIYDDVPAVTNFPNGQVIPSHPGTNLLWYESFDTSQYISSPAGSGSEQFFDPPSFGFIGIDNQAFYYCFYPTNQFLQQGTAAEPTNYWLAVRAQLQDTATTFGWKTSLSNYNDGAVWGTVTNGFPIGDWQTMTNNQLPTTPINLAFKLNTQPTQPPLCVETNTLKYEQLPQVFSGYDVWNDGPYVLADDFICSNTGPISDIHLWGSFLSNQVVTNLTFYLAIYDDVPKSPTNTLGYSYPGNLLWTETFTPGEYAQNFYTNGQETFLDPGPPNIMGPDSQVWYFCFYPTNEFVQLGTASAPKTYWLMVYAQKPAGVASEYYGWKTATTVRNDTSVHANWPGMVPAANPGWVPTHDVAGAPLDLSFKVYTSTNTPPPTGCVDTNDGVKYSQLPNLRNGYDVWNVPYVLADDFICTNTGKITDLHLWGSWLNDQAATNTINFWLGIYSDVPVSATNSFSHPGNLLWYQWFAPGQYSETFWGKGNEAFLDPGPPNIIGPETNVWYYCFFPTNPLVQTGTAAAPTTYWLAAYAQLPTGGNDQYGWKTTTNVQHDISVHAQWPGVPPTNNPGWTPTFVASTGGPLDLAFMVTTPTNQCLFALTCPVPNKTVECGTSWVFDPPTVSYDTCCPTGVYTTNLVVVTNTFGTCSEVLTANWTITDCIGQKAYCSQTVTVQDTTPPSISCPTNKTVECGTVWSFGTPTAFDTCCGTNVTISVVSTVTNGLCPLFVIRTWQATDCCSNSSTCSQTVTIADTTPPTINCPSNIIASTCDSNISVGWTMSASDVCSGTNVTVSSMPASPHTFLADTTNTVTVTAVDQCGNTNHCTFTVAVVRPVLGGLTITSPGTNVVIAWTNGILQSATNVVGPYTDVLGATSPYTNSHLLPMKYYRLRCMSP